MSDFTGSPLQHPIDPPLTRASRLIRSESLPLFYGTCTFRIVVEGQHRYAPHVGHWSKHFLNSLSDIKLQNIRKLEVLVCSLVDLDLAWPEEIGKARVEFTQSMDSYSVSFQMIQYERAVWGDRVPAFTARLSTVFDQIVNRQGPHKLKISDLLGLDSKEINLLGAMCDRVYR